MLLLILLGTKLLLNVRLNQLTTVSKQTDKVVRLICLNYAEETSDESNSQNSSNDIAKILNTYLLKTKTNQVSYVYLFYI